MINPNFCKNERKFFCSQKKLVGLYYKWIEGVPIGTSLQASILNGAHHAVKLTLFTFKASSLSCEVCI
jgi:hypothetical protein